jgi:hypothetical protein
MRFEKIKEPKKDDKVHKLIDDFIKTNYDRVEVINEDDYRNNNAMISALRWVIKNDYPNTVKASKIRERVYLSKIDFDYS